MTATSTICRSSKREDGFIFQSFNSSQCSTGREHRVSARCGSTRSRRPLRKRVEALAEAVGLKPQLHPNRTSSRRAAAAGGHRPGLDYRAGSGARHEPTANLDSSPRVIIDRMLELNRKNKVTFSRPTIREW